MKSDYETLIRTEAANLTRLHQKIHETLPYRRKHRKGYKDWKAACEAFHSYKSPLFTYIRRAYEEKHYADEDILEFVVCFLELDPWFFRSGYFKEKMLRKLGSSTLPEHFERRLREVLLDAVDRRGSREFRHYCRLAARIADQELVDRLCQAKRGGDEKRARRAKMMLHYIEQHAET
jgi:hypothetical protein